MKEISVGEIISKIEGGLPVEYDHVAIKGNLNLNQTHLPFRYIERGAAQVEHKDISNNLTIIDSPIRINDSKFEGSVNLSNTEFLSQIDFRNTEFNQSANFRGCIFQESADFAGVNFNRSEFGLSQFNETANFKAAQFREWACFSEARFIKAANFNNTVFSMGCDYGDAQFMGCASFSHTEFHRRIHFQDARFSDQANFKSSNFSNVFFNNARFNGSASFEGSQFNGVSQFSDAQFGEDAKFENSKFNGTTNILYLNFTGEPWFDFNVTGINKIGEPISSHETLVGNYEFTKSVGLDGDFTEIDGALGNKSLNWMELKDRNEIKIKLLNRSVSFLMGTTNLTTNITVAEFTSFNLSSSKISADFRRPSS